MADIDDDDNGNTIIGTPDADTINGNGGNDTISGGDGDDTLSAGDGYDKLYGEGGNDTLIGGGENDELFGGDDADTFIVNSVGTPFNPNNTTVWGGSGGDDDDTLNVGWFYENGYALQHSVQNPDSDGNGFNGQMTFYNASTNQWANVNYHDIENIVICFTPQTAIATSKGEVAVENLNVGDKVFTRDNGPQAIKWIGRRDLTAKEMERQKDLMPVLIEKGALGGDLPERDLMVSPQHRVLLASDRAALYFEEREVLTAAKHLVGLPGISRVKPLETSYIHFLCDRHEVVLSNGCWTESFQPGERSLSGLDEDARDEVFRLFPDLATANGVKGYEAARKTLKGHEAKLLMTE